MASDDEETESLVDNLFREVDDHFGDLEREYNEARRELATADLDRSGASADPVEATAERYELLSEVASLRAELTRRGEQLDERDRLLSVLGERMGEFEVQIAAGEAASAAETEVRHQLLDERREVSRLKALLDARVAERTELAEVAHRLQGEKEHIADLLKTALARFEQVDRVRAEMTERLSRLETARQSEAADLAARSEQIADAKAESKRLSELVAELTVSRDEAEKRANKLEGLVERRSNEVGYLNRRIDALMAQTERVAELEERIAELERDNALKGRRVNELENQLETQSVEVVASAKAVEALAERSSERDEFAAKVAELERALDRAARVEAAGAAAPPPTLSSAAAEIQRLTDLVREMGSRRGTDTPAPPWAPAPSDHYEDAIRETPRQDPAPSDHREEVIRERPRQDPAPSDHREEVIRETPRQDPPRSDHYEDAISETPPPVPHVPRVEIGDAIDLRDEARRADLEEPPDPDEGKHATPPETGFAGSSASRLSEAESPAPPPASGATEPPPLPMTGEGGEFDEAAPPEGSDTSDVSHGASVPVDTGGTPDTGGPDGVEQAGWANPPRGEDSSAALDAGGVEPPASTETGGVRARADWAAEIYETAVVGGDGSAEIDGTAGVEQDASTAGGTADQHDANKADDAGDGLKMAAEISPPSNSSQLLDADADESRPEPVDVPRFDLGAPVSAVGAVAPVGHPSVRQRAILPSNLEPNTEPAVEYLLAQRGVTAIVDARSCCSRTGLRPSELFDRVAALRDRFDLPVEVVVTPVSTPVGGAPELENVGVHHVTGADTVADRVRGLCMGFPADQALVVIAGDDYVRRAAIGENANVIDPGAAFSLTQR